jgi:MFS family permease
MEERMPFKEFFVRQKSFLLVFSLILNTVVWFYAISYMSQFTSPALATSASSLRWLFYLAVVMSALVGPIVAERVDRMRFLFFWVLLGVTSSLFPLVLPTSGDYGVAALLVFWGFAFGIGFPSCLALIPAVTKIEERGRAGGKTFLATYAILPLFLPAIEHLDVFSGSILLAAWRSLSLGVFLLHIDTGDAMRLKPVSYLSILRRRTFLLYFLPWLAFGLVNGFETQVLEHFYGEPTAALMVTVAFVVGSLSCLIGGWLMDLKERKRIIIAGLVALGLGYALLSFFPRVPLVQAFYVVVDGVAFGIFTVAFVFVVWGDMPNGERGEKFYALGNIATPMAVMLSVFFSPWLKMVDISSASSLASFFLLLAIIPVSLAPELLPEKVIEEREMRKYAEKVKEVLRR